MFWIDQTINLRAENRAKIYEQALVARDKHAHTWRVTVLDDARQTTLDGMTAEMFVMRADGRTVESQEQITIDGHTVSATLPGEAYDVEGPVALEMVLRRGEETVTCAQLGAYVKRTRTDDVIVPGTGELYDVYELIKQINAMKEATSSANAAASSANAWANATATATALAAGSAPTVSVGTSGGEKVLEFGIPKGDRGDKGEKGDKGDTGETGPTGKSGVAVSDTEPTDPEISVWINEDGSEDVALDATTLGGRGPDDYASAEEVGQLKADVEKKQDKLIPGEGITIGNDGRTISADGAGGSDFYKLIVPGKTYQTIPGKAFNGFGKLNDFEDAFLVLVEVPAECAFLIVSKFNYQVAYGSGFRYSIPQYLDADCNRISQCKVNNAASTVDNSNDFSIITLVDVPENAAYIAIPYKNGTEYSVEYGYVHYADKIGGCLIDGHLPYGIQLFEDGLNLVQKIFSDVSYVPGNLVFNIGKGSRCTQPVLYKGGARIYHDGTANTMYYYAFDNANGFISSGIINNGGDLPEIENVAYLIFQSPKDFTYISYSDLSLSGYKQSKKIRDDLLDFHLTQKKLEYPYHGMVASFLGDSLTAGGSGGDYTEYLNSFFAFSRIKNCGIGGTRISGESSVFGDPMWMDSRINALDIDSDIIFIMGGTNDAPSGDQYLGDITPENHDTSTFVGAYNVLLSKIFYRYGLFDGLYDGIDYSGVVQAGNARDVRIFLITPPQRFPNRGSTENPWHYAVNTNMYADAVLQIGAMHGIPVADIRGCAGVNIFNRDRYICGTDVPNRNGSGVHLSKDAHKRWAEVIIGKMLDVVSVD